MYMPSLMSRLSILADTVSVTVILSHVCHISLQTVFVSGYMQFNTLFPFINFQIMEIAYHDSTTYVLTHAQNVVNE